MSSNSEYKTIEIMIHMYCAKMHGKKKLCSDCENILNYATKKIELCPNKKSKPPCNACKIHCYKPDMRIKIKEAMKFSGPRMVLRHPIIAIKHLIGTIKAKRLR